jgi:hypothetical protein
VLAVSPVVAPESAVQIHQADVIWARHYRGSAMLSSYSLLQTFLHFLSVGCSACQPVVLCKISPIGKINTSLDIFSLLLAMCRTPSDCRRMIRNCYTQFVQKLFERKFVCYSALITQICRPGFKRNTADPAGMCNWQKNLLAEFFWVWIPVCAVEALKYSR